jgi:hypothetical protein
MNGKLLPIGAIEQHRRACPGIWRNSVRPAGEDLDAFLEVLHAEHDNPYFHTPRAEFELAIADYRAALPGLSASPVLPALWPWSVTDTPG